MTDAPSWWWADLGGLPAPRPALDGDREADVCIVGAGYTGLWTAYELLRADPSLAVVVLEREVAGFGASGRNGGWVLGEISTGSRQRDAAGEAGDRGARARGPETVDEVGAACAREGIDCDFVKGGSLTVAQTAPAARAPARRHRAASCSTSTRPPRRVRVAGLRGARFTPHCARVQPAKLARGLAAAVERHGATIHEGTAALDDRRRAACATPRAPCARAGSCAPPRATPPALPGLERALLPLSSSMIVTEPLDADDVGADRLGGLRDARRRRPRLHLRPADGRRADRHRRARAPVPLRLGHRPRRRDPRRARSASCARASRACSPSLRDVRLDGAWTGVFGVARDWAAAVHCDRDSGLCWAGGYAGEGVAAANLAARTLRDLDPRPRHRARAPAVGGPPRARLGARAAALARRCRRSTAPSAPPTRSRTAPGGRRGWRRPPTRWPAARRSTSSPPSSPAPHTVSAGECPAAVTRPSPLPGKRVEVVGVARGRAVHRRVERHEPAALEVRAGLVAHGDARAAGPRLGGGREGERADGCRGARGAQHGGDGSWAGPRRRAAGHRTDASRRLDRCRRA